MLVPVLHWHGETHPLPPGQGAVAQLKTAEAFGAKTDITNGTEAANPILLINWRRDNRSASRWRESGRSSNLVLPNWSKANHTTSVPTGSPVSS
jgi:hypothetical protein